MTLACNETTSQLILINEVLINKKHVINVNIKYYKVFRLKQALNVYTMNCLVQGWMTKIEEYDIINAGTLASNWFVCHEDLVHGKLCFELTCAQSVSLTKNSYNCHNVQLIQQEMDLNCYWNMSLWSWIALRAPSIHYCLSKYHMSHYQLDAFKKDNWFSYILSLQHISGSGLFHIFFIINIL